MKKITLVLLFFLLLFNLYAQNKAKVLIKEGQFLRLESNSHSAVDSSVSILVPKNNDEKDKDRPKQDSIFKGKIVSTPIFRTYLSLKPSASKLDIR